MSIEKISTSAIVVALYDSGENDSLIKLYTREFGMILALSKGLKKSFKLRSHLLLGRVTTVTLVKGKEIYRLVGAQECVANSGNNLKYFIGIITRLVQGEIKNTRLYDRLLKYGKIKNVDLSILKLTVSADLLIVLGYLDTKSLGHSIEDYLSMDVEEFMLSIQLKKSNTIHMVKQGLQDSML
jgi:recombinational DNA repair protein (RecF pathway)